MWGSSTRSHADRLSSGEARPSSGAAGSRKLLPGSHATRGEVPAMTIRSFDLHTWLEVAIAHREAAEAERQKEAACMARLECSHGYAEGLA